MCTMFQRAEIKTLTGRLKKPRQFIQVVMGPRQVGKTTLVTQLFNQLKKPGFYESADAIPASRTKKGIYAFQKRFNPWKTYQIDNQHISWKEFLRINPLELF